MKRRRTAVALHATTTAVPMDYHTGPAAGTSTGKLSLAQLLSDAMLSYFYCKFRCMLQACYVGTNSCLPAHLCCCLNAVMLLFQNPYESAKRLHGVSVKGSAAACHAVLPPNRPGLYHNIACTSFHFIREI